MGTRRSFNLWDMLPQFVQMKDVSRQLPMLTGRQGQTWPSGPAAAGVARTTPAAAGSGSSHQQRCSYAAIEQEVEQVTVAQPVNLLRVVPEVQAFIRARPVLATSSFDPLNPALVGGRQLPPAARSAHRAMGKRRPPARTPSRMPRINGVRRELSPAASDFTATSASTFDSTRHRTEAEAVDEVEAVAAAAAADASLNPTLSAGCWWARWAIFGPDERVCNALSSFLLVL